MSKSEQKERDRKGLTVFTVWLDPELTRQIKILAAEEKTQIWKLVTEFFNDGLEKHGKARVE